MSEFNIFSAATKEGIRVGYVDPDRGYISSNSIYEANLYASKNPGAVFILETRNKIRYLSINQVNKLTTKDLKVGGICPEGIKGLRPGETPTYAGGKHPLVVNGNPVKIDSRGGTPLTSGGRGGRPVTAGGQPVTTKGVKVKVGGTGGNQIRLGGTGGDLVYVGNDILTINGTEVRSGGQDGTLLKFGGTDGTKVVKDGINECEGQIYITGGGGVGATAVPVFGKDGSLLAAIVTQGGYGYKTPPHAKLIDTCNRGVGVVLKAFLGEVGEKEIVYDREEDFEIYNLTPPEGLVGYGKRFGPNGEDLGPWDPNLFASLSKDPIGLEIQNYQNFLLDGINPWWTTRKETPLEVIFRDKNNRVKHDVQHWAWGGKTAEVKNPPTKQDQLEDVKFKVFTQGGNQADRGLVFNFVAEDGSHKFQFKANSFKDSRKETVTRKVKRNTVYKITSSGSFKGGGTEQGLIGGLGRDAKEIKGNKKGSVIFADFVESSNDNDDLQVEATQGKFTASNERKENGHSINDLTYKFESNKDFKPQTKTKKVIEDSFMNRYAISPTPPSDVPGSDYAGRVATFVWEEDFPYSGEYKFRGMADNIGKIFLDNELILEERRFKGDPVKVISKTITAGVHEIKVELFNIPIKEKPKPVKKDLTITYHGLNQGSTKTVSGEKSYAIRTEGASGSSGRRVVNGGKEVQFDDDADGGFDENASLKIESTSPGVSAKFNNDGTQMIVKGSGDVSLKFEWDDNPRTSGLAVGTLKVGNGEQVSWTSRQKGERGSDSKTIKVGNNDSTEVIGKGGFIVSGNKVKMKDGHGDDINSTFSIKSSTNNAKISTDGKRIIADGPGKIVVKLEWDDNPKTAGVAVDKITVGGVTLNQRGQKGSATETITIDAPKTTSSSNQSQSYESIFNTADYINKADRKLWRTNVYGRNGFLSENGVCPFDTKKPLEDNPYAGKHVIRWESINFPNDGNYNITVDADDSVKIFIGNRDGAGKMSIGNGLRDVNDEGDEVIIENGMKKQTYVRFFKKGKYRIRTELTQIPGGRFSFDENGKPGGADVTARFIERGNEKYLKVEGSGSAEIHFRLRTDDNPRTSGVFASKIKIGKGIADSVELRRTKDSRGGLKEKELITGSAFFESGREYLVQTFNSSSTTGSIVKNKGQTIEFDDNISNGFDENADLTISKISNQQKPKLKGINPMALAIDIKTSASEEVRISPRTWYQNPMGAAFTIDAPLPPKPQEPKPQQEGRCPNNPLWTTRFSGGSESWWPVINTKFSSKTNTYVWSKFLNRFAISPLPPLSTPNSDGGGGIVYSNTWNVDFPDTGFYGFKGSCDDKGRILVDGQEVYRLRGRLNTSPKIIKQKITKGNHTVTVEVENVDFRKRKKITKEIFNTQKWQKPLNSTSQKIDVDFKVTSSAKFANSVEMKGVFSFSKSYDGSQIKESTSKKLESGKIYDVIFNSNRKGGGGNKGYQISYDGLNSANSTINSSNKELKFKDGDGGDANAKFKIMSSSPGVDVKFSSDGRSLDVKGSGNVTLRLEWDDNPSIAGVALKSISLGEKTWRQNGRSGEQTETIKVSGGSSGSQGNNSTIKLRTRGDTVIQMEDHTDNDWSDIVVSSSAGRFFDIKGNKAKFVAGKSFSGLASGTSIGGITYSGPALFNFKHPAWSDFMNKFSISPYSSPLDSDNPNINGLTTYKWSNVKFPESGKYVVSFQADNIGKLFINGAEITEIRSFRGESELKFFELNRGTYDIEVQLTNVPSNKNIFNSNPAGFALKITKDITIVTSESPAWKTNPVGVSAIIIPPPCRKKVVGTGFVERIEVMQPGNGYPPPGDNPTTATPIKVTLQLIDIDPSSTGIGYTPGDRVIVDTPGGGPIEFIPTLNTFGQIIDIPITTTPGIPSPPGDPNDGSGTPGNPGDPDPSGPDDPGDGTGRFTTIETPPIEILQVTDLPGEIGVADDTGVLIPLIPSGGSVSGQTNVPEPGPFYGFTEYPNIYPTSNTGLGFRGRPVFKVVIVPEDILPDESVLQVVDIPGLRKTGYVNGKPYYGQVFAKDGNLYAGISETIGQLVPVYATLQESILNRQTIQPSAILRSGSETNSNNPNLNIPNTPDNLI